jgi:hypothetical protein
MSARSRYLLQRDIARESTDIGKKAAEAGDYFAREKRSTQIGGSLGAYAGVQLAGLIAGGPITWGAAAVAAGLGYLVGGKAGEEISERKESGQWMIGKEDKYSNEQSGFHRELKDRGKFLKEDRKLTSESLMQAKKGADLLGGIGKGALMASATAGIKYGAVDDIKTKIKAGKFSWMLPEKKQPAFGAGNLKDAGKITKEGAEYENMLDKINKAKPPVIDTIKDASNPRVIADAGFNPYATFDEALGTMEENVAKGIDAQSSGTLADNVLPDQSKHILGNVHQQSIGDVPATQKLFGAIPQGETINQEALDQANVINNSFAEASAQNAKRTNELRNKSTLFGQAQQKSKLQQTFDLSEIDNYEGGITSTSREGGIVGGRGDMPASEIPEGLAIAEQKKKEMEFFAKNLDIKRNSKWDLQPSEIDYAKGTEMHTTGIPMDHYKKLNKKDTSAFGMEDFTEQSYEKTINEIDYKKTMGQDFAKSQKLEGVKDISVKPASVADAHQQAIAQFYDPALTATESWGNTANIKAFKESSIYSSLPGKTASNKYYNWHNMVSKAYKANQ